MSDTKPLPDNVIPIGKKPDKVADKDKDSKKEGENLEEQNKDTYKRLQDAARARRTTNNSNVTRNYRLTPKGPKP